MIGCWCNAVSLAVAVGEDNVMKELVFKCFARRMQPSTC